MFTQLSNNIHVLMAKRRISISELARHTGIPASTLKKIKGAHQTNPTLSTLTPLAQFFDITLEQLLLSDMSATVEHALGTLLPVLTWEDALLWPKQSYRMRKRIASEHPAHFALQVTQPHGSQFLVGAVLIVQTDALPAHGDYLIIQSDQPQASLKQLWQEDNVNYLESLSVKNHIVAMSENHRVIGVVLECRHIIKT